MTPTLSNSQTSRQTSLTPTFRPDIEGLRAVAILLVVAYHARIPYLSGGYVGVDIFFVLSGYLITWLLVQEVERTGTISLSGFYARRARRLIPALALVLIITVPVAALVYAPYEHRFLAHSAISTAAYFSNIYFARVAFDYHGADAATNPFLHTWSLGVEEQFYLVWPLFVLVGYGALRKRQWNNNRSRLLWWMALAAATSFGLSSYMTKMQPIAAFFYSPARAWEFAFGAIALLLPVNGLSRWIQLRNRGKYRTSNSSAPRAPIGVLGWIGLAGIILSGFAFDNATPFPGLPALLPALSTAFILRAQGNTLISRALSIRPFQAIGRLSYSWYLWHWPVLVLAEVLYGPMSIWARLGMMLLALSFAALSYVLVENPIRHNRKLASRPAYPLLMAAVFTILFVALALVWKQRSLIWAATPQQAVYTQTRLDVPVIYGRNCDPSVASAEFKLCSFGPQNAANTAILFGDSHAAQWFPTAQAIFVDRGWRLIVMTKAACPAVDSPFFYEPIHRTYSECDEWRAKAIDKIRELRPDIVMVSSRAKYSFSQDQLKVGTFKVLASLSESSRHVLLIRDTPDPGIDVTMCMARSSWRPAFLPNLECKINVSDNKFDPVYSIQEELAGRFPNVSTIDLNAYICDRADCKIVRNGVFLYRDDHHLSNAFAASLAGEFAKRIRARFGDLAY